MKTAAICSAIREGKSINQISKELDVYKSTIYYHYKKIKGRKLKPIEFRTIPADEIGEIIGAFAGDGNFYKDKAYHYTVQFLFGYCSEEYARRFEQLLINSFGKKPLRCRAGAGEFALRYRSKRLYLWIRERLDWDGKKTHSVCLRDLNAHDKQFLIGFLRGLLDTDGHAVRKYRQIRFNTVSQTLANQISEILDILSISNRLSAYSQLGKAKIYEIRVNRTDAVILSQLLKPRNPGKIKEWSSSPIVAP